MLGGWRGTVAELRPSQPTTRHAAFRSQPSGAGPHWGGDVYFVFTGGAANSLSLASLCQSYHSVICTPVAHIETDECGGPEFFSNGSKLLVVPSPTCAESPCREHEINGLAKKSALRFSQSSSGALGCLSGDLRHPDAFRQHDAEAIEQRSLCRIRLRNTVQSNVAVRVRRQNHVVRLNARQFFAAREDAADAFVINTVILINVALIGARLSTCETSAPFPARPVQQQVRPHQIRP